MFAEEYSGVNSFLVGASALLLKYGVVRDVRGKICTELPEPACFKITNPLAREITIPERKWSKHLAYAEALWIASGRNDMNYITNYLKRMSDFSDDGLYMRGGYGPRLRHYNHDTIDYKIDDVKFDECGIDQLRYVCDCFAKDPYTRQATITLSDVNKDDFGEDGNLKVTKDIPCTRELHFQRQASSDKLDLIVKMRSNDLIWGTSAVNIFNYTFLQEYMSAILNMKIGNYYHVVDNLHYYQEFSGLVHSLSKVKDVAENPAEYGKTFKNLAQFNSLIEELSFKESLLRLGHDMTRQSFDDPFFEHWYDVLYSYNCKNKRDC